MEKEPQRISRLLHIGAVKCMVVTEPGVKSDPEIFLKGAEFLGLSPEECAVVEDAGAGILAAKAGG